MKAAYCGHFNIVQELINAHIDISHKTKVIGTNQACAHALFSRKQTVCHSTSILFCFIVHIYLLLTLKKNNLELHLKQWK